jgi:hypothetical protein
LSVVTGRSSALVWLIALVFLGLHLLHLPRSLEDIDSVNFALGVEHYDVARHQPHPPGYPVYIGAATLSTRAAAVVAPGWDRDRRAAVGLAIWSLITATAAAFVLLYFWTAAGVPRLPAVFATMLAMASPLFWITAVRPLTDMPGLVGALLAQAWLLVGWRQVQDGVTTIPRAWTLAAFSVGLLVGVRSQVVWLTAPLLAWVLGELAWRGRWKQSARLAALTIAGVLVWALPLVWLSGGIDAYVVALGAQGAEDFLGVDMLATVPTMRMAALALWRTFILPWQSPVLGQVIAVLAMVGIVRLIQRSPSVLAVICLAFWPYAVFHLIFHETETTRYALPLMVPMAGLAVVGLATFGARATSLVSAGAVIASLALGHPHLRAYGAEAAPTSRVLRDMDAARASTGSAPRLLMHHQVWWGWRRTVDWYRGAWNPQPFPGDREWLQIVDHFRAGRTAPIWLLADSRRSDTTLFDHRTRTVRGQYGRSPALQRIVGGDRLETATWWEIRTPGWMLGRGWALTPEVGGATSQDNRQPHRQPAEGWLKRTSGPHRLMIGGRYLGGTRDAALVLRLDGRELARWTVAPSPVWFVRWLDLPDGSLEGPGPYAALTVGVQAADGSTVAPELGLEQFDFAPAGALMYAFTDGWQELEEDPTTGRQWRWSSERNTIEIYAGGRDVEVRLAGESPLEYFSSAPTVRVDANGATAGSFTPNTDFDENVAISAAALRSQPSTVTIGTDKVFVPAELGNSPDRRRLGLRLFRVELRER